MTAQVILGHVHLRFGDILRASWTPRIKITLGVLAIAITAINISQSSDLIFGQDDMVPGLISIFVTVAICILIWFLIMIACVAIGYRRMRDGHLDITYEMSAEMQVISDTSGIRINIPWNIVKNAREDRHAFRLNLKPGGQRYYPKRAFSEPDAIGVRVLLREKLGMKARLNG